MSSSMSTPTSSSTSLHRPLHHLPAGTAESASTTVTVAAGAPRSSESSASIQLTASNSNGLAAVPVTSSTASPPPVTPPSASASASTAASTSTSTSTRTPTSAPTSRPGVTPITGRLRASSRSSGSTPTLSKLNKRYSPHSSSAGGAGSGSGGGGGGGSSYSYSAHGLHGLHPRHRSSVPAPKVLPFPDLSNRIGTTSRDGSRPGSPTHPSGHTYSASHTPPHATPRGSSTDVTLSGMLGLPPGTTLSRRNSSLALSPPRQLPAAAAAHAGGGGSGVGSIGMVAGGSWDGRVRSGSGSAGGETPSRRTSAGNDTAIATPGQGGRFTPVASRSQSSRPRAQTGPVSARPNIVSPRPISILRTDTISPPPSPAPHMHVGRAAPIPIAVPAPAMARFAQSSTPPPPPPIEKDGADASRQRMANSNSRSEVQAAQLSVVITPTPATQPLADHLYNSFLRGECADVRLYVRKWGVAWKVHKMVLVQAGFFNSLFLGGFSENRHPDVQLASSRKGKERAREIEDDWTGEHVELQFDDPNITRAAFEICLSRLYSPHPRLHFPSLLLPTPALPLTPAFPLSPALSAPLLSARDALPENAELATPRLLLSLLATSIYLGYNPLIREVTAMILRTVSPSSVGRYLGFAIGDGIGEEEWDGQDDEAARGLENVAQRLPDKQRSDQAAQASKRQNQGPHSTQSSPRKSSYNHRDSTASDGKYEDDVKVGSAPFHDKMQSHSEPTRTRSMQDEHDHVIDPDETIRVDQSHMPHFYGSISNKIGEAAVCWLSRWALDLLHVELALPKTAPQSVGAGESWKVFGYGGIPARFIRALLSSDSFFVRSEMERYRVARAILDLRRSGFEAELNGDATQEDRDSGDIGTGTTSTLLDDVVREEDEDDSASQHETEMWDAWEEEEQEMMRIFAEGVYYSHMSFEDLSEIAKDIDPHTHLPYAPLPVLQAAHWAAADLKARIVAHEIAPANESATPVDTQDTSELGLAVHSRDLATVSSRSTRRIASRGRLASAASNASTSFRSSSSMSNNALAFGLGHPTDGAIYHPIPGDDTFRSGAGGLLFQPTAVTATSPIPGIPGIPDLCGPGGAGDNEDGGKKRAPPQGETTFFGLAAFSRTATQIASAHLGNPTLGVSQTAGAQAERWSKTEPFRFSVEFWGVDKLAEKERLYSTTHFHAGSYWNVYVQTIRKKDKGTQLGIYLHRQSKGEGFPPASCPPTAAANEVEEAYDGMTRDAVAEAGGGAGVSARRREGVLEGYGQALNASPGGRDRGREGRSMSEGGSERMAQARRGRSSDNFNGEREALGRYDDQRAVLPRTGSVAAGLDSQSFSRSFGHGAGHAQALSLGSSYGSPATGLLGQALRSSEPDTSPLVGSSRHRTQPSSISSTSAVLGLGTSSRTAAHPHRASTSAEMRRVSSGFEDDPQATYRDSRRITKAYFSITCASALGTALIRFSSSPDSFTLSQSWGWKSSALRSEEYLASSAAREAEGELVQMVDIEGLGGADGVKGWSGMLVGAGAGLDGREIGGSGSLRATVVVGVI